MLKIVVELNNKEKSSLSGSFLKKIVKNTLEVSDISNIKKGSISISFANISEKEIENLNANYRGVKKATDVLSFPEFKTKKEISNEKSEDLFLGEIVLCYNNIAKYAKRFKLNMQAELCEVIAHGVLHLLCYRHGKKMFDIQKKIKKYGKIRYSKSQH